MTKLLCIIVTQLKFVLDKGYILPPYGECQNCHYKKTVLIDYVGTRGYHYIYKEK